MSDIIDQSKTIKFYNAVSIILFMILAGLSGLLFLLGLIHWIAAVVIGVISLIGGL